MWGLSEVYFSSYKLTFPRVVLFYQHWKNEEMLWDMIFEHLYQYAGEILVGYQMFYRKPLWNLKVYQLRYCWRHHATCLETTVLLYPHGTRRNHRYQTPCWFPETLRHSPLVMLSHWMLDYIIHLYLLRNKTGY